MLEQLLVVGSAAIVGFLGGAHLLFTFVGQKLAPRDPSLQQAMERSPLVITRQTTVWRAWIGFNASHALGLLLFATTFAYLALAHPAILFGSVPLLAIGAATLMTYLVLARAYWFATPFRGIAVALVCYGAAVIWSRVA